MRLASRIVGCVGTVLLVCVVLAPSLAAASVYNPALTAYGVLAFTNAERYRAGFPLLESNPVLAQVAANKMADLFARQYFAHESPDGKNVGDLAQNIGYQYLTIGENLALGDFVSNAHIVQAWMDSPGHRKNILSATYSEIGIAVGRGLYEEQTVWIAVQAFGLPRSNCPIADQDLRAKINRLEDTLTLMAKLATLRKEAYESLRPTSPSRQTLVESYNLVVSLYNERADEYRALVKTYNKQVDTSNTCIERTINE